MEHFGQSGATTATRRLEAAQELVSRHNHLVVVSAMSPQQPDHLLASIIRVARHEGVRLKILFADLTGSLAFLDHQARNDVLEGSLELVSLAGVVPRDLSPHISHFSTTLWDIDRQLSAGHIHVDAFVARVHRTEEATTVSLGPMVGYTTSALAVANLVCLEIAPAFTGPHTVSIILTESQMTYRDDEYLPPAVNPAKPWTDEQWAIAKNVSDIIPNEATIQLGLGAVPEAVASSLTGKHDLGLHSGILPISLAGAIAAGVFTGVAKDSHIGKHVATGVMSPIGREGETWPDSVLLLPLSETHSPSTLQSIKRLWSINSAFEIDLFGRVNAEYVNKVRVAAGGGQADFFHGAHISPEGGSVLALPSRTTQGLPRLVPCLGDPCVSTTPPSDIDFVVTEHGVAALSGLTALECRDALISIAHPADRSALAEAARGTLQAP